MLEFIYETHTYLLDGKIIPSVSEILSFIFPEKYKGIPREILDKKANFGTNIHLAVELYEKHDGDRFEIPEEFFAFMEYSLNYIEAEAFNQYVKLREKHNIKVEEQETMVCFLDVYAGRFDMIANIDGHRSLADIKTTATLDEEYLSWQLSLYELATGQTFEKLYAIWLPKKGLGKLVEIQRIDRTVLLDKLREYEKSKQEEI